MKLLPNLLLACSVLTAWANTNAVFLAKLHPIQLAAHGHSTFLVKFIPSSHAPIVKTNNLLTVHDVPAGLLDGEYMLEVQTVDPAGEISVVSSLWIKLRRAPLPPVLVPVRLEASEADAKSLEDIMFERRRARALSPAPAPPGAVVLVSSPPPPPPMPNATNLSFRAYLEREASGQRRGN